MDSRSAMIEAAIELFSQRGFDGTSVDEIAARAGLTKPTVYRHFENKGALFAAALERLLAKLPPPEVMVSRRRGALRNRLVAIAHDALRLGTGAVMASLHRMLSLPMDSAPYRAEQVWNENIQPYNDAMQRLLREERGAGALAIPDVARAASHFYSLIAGEPMVRLFLTGESAMSGKSVDGHVEAAVDAFLRAYRPSRASRN